MSTQELEILSDEDDCVMIYEKINTSSDLTKISNSPEKRSKKKTNLIENYKINDTSIKFIDKLTKNLTYLEKEFASFQGNLNEIKSNVNECSQIRDKNIQHDYFDKNSKRIVQEVFPIHLLNKKDHDQARIESNEQCIFTENFLNSGTSKLSEVRLSDSKDNTIEEDLIQVSSFQNGDSYFNVPPVIKMIRKSLKIGDLVYSATNPSFFSSTPWEQAIIKDIIRLDGKILFEVAFHDIYRPKLYLRASQIAYKEALFSLIPNGTRIVSFLKNDPNLSIIQHQLYSGVVADPPKRTNHFRYLIFFDSGEVRYAKWDEVFEIVEKNTFFEDVNPEQSEFLTNYFKEYPERAMVKFQINEKIKVLVNNTWVVGKVEEIDCTLVKLNFKSLSKKQWIYRGSDKLYPLSKHAFLESEKLHAKFGKKNQRAIKIITRSRLRNKSRPFVQYTRADTNDESLDEEGSTIFSDNDFSKKITSHNVLNENSSETDQSVRLTRIRKQINSANYKYEIKVVNDEEPIYKPRKFISHNCNKTCILEQSELLVIRDENPFSLPIKFGWERQIVTHKASKDSKRTKEIYYVAPCGRRLRSIDEVEEYLNRVDCLWSIDFFTFSPELRLYVETEEGPKVKCYYYEKDLACGSENHSIPIINTLNDMAIVDFNYCAARFPSRGVNIIMDTDFLPCCQCTDNCRNHSTCQCQKITIESSNIFRGKGVDHNIGYKHRRLMEPSISGIFECNSRCPCNEKCPNKLVQLGMRVKLQIFRTEKKGWGIQSLHDIPPNTFICIYAAEIFDNSDANDIGMLHGDEYLADLDYIDIVEAAKEGYESAVEEDISSSDEENDNVRKKCRNDKEVKKKKYSEIETPRKPLISIRKLFGEDFRYTLDAKRYGNIGKYLNHSCDPNCFVQNVFIDTHDLRFPWVAFFSSRFIPAFTEITWDYNYQVGSVQGRKLYCYCGSKRCKGRLL